MQLVVLDILSGVCLSLTRFLTDFSVYQRNLIHKVCEEKELFHELTHLS